MLVKLGVQGSHVECPVGVLGSPDTERPGRWADLGVIDRSDSGRPGSTPGSGEPAWGDRQRSGPSRGAGERPGSPEEAICDPGTWEGLGD